MRVLSALIALAICVTSVNTFAARPGQATSSASLSGTASDSSGHALANAAVQLRDVSTGKLAGTATTNGLGQFSFMSLPPGTYVVEVAKAGGQIVGASGSVAVSAGASVTGVGVTASAAAGTAAATAAAAGGFSSHAVAIVLGAAAAAGVAGGVAMATGGTASASQ